MPRPAPSASSGSQLLAQRSPQPYLSKAAHHLLHQGAHGRDVDDLEVINIDGAIHVDVLPYLTEHAHQGHVGLPCTLRGKSETDNLLNRS